MMRSRSAGAVAVLLFGLTGGCAGNPGVDSPVGSDGRIDAELAGRAVEATRIDAPISAVFEWRMREREARFSGRGAARVAPEYHARLDLFGPQDALYFSAAMVDSELRLPPNTADAVIPPPALLWTVLGVLNPPADAQLVGTAGDADRLRLEYARGDDRWRFELRNMQLVRAEWNGGGSGRHTVELEPGGGALPAEAEYRDHVEYRELILRLEDIENVDTFPADVWQPGAR